MRERGVVSHERIRRGAHRSGPNAVAEPRRRAQSRDTWHMDEVRTTLNVRP